MQQSILHANSVWSIAVLPNGDVVTACGDGGVRVWTNDKDRMAPADLKQLQIEQAMAAAAEASQKGASAVPMSDQPDISTMATTPGTKPGQVKMFRDGAKTNAYSWNGRGWDLIGEVMG